jgi:hypothetical protein
MSQMTLQKKLLKNYSLELGGTMGQVVQIRILRFLP